jgi:ribonuclease-3
VTTALEQLQQRIGYTFTDLSRLRLALTHRSVTNETSEIEHNERFEFLGDAIVDFVLSDLLFVAYPNASEGELSRLRASAVNQTALAEKARQLGLGAALRLGEGERKSGGAEKDSLLADAYEAVAAAIYFDGGSEAAFAFVRRSFSGDMSRLVANDPKTELQHFCQKQHHTLPVYTIVSETGPEHARLFICEVSVAGKVLGRGEGRAKKIAEQAAARDALAHLS